MEVLYESIQNHRCNSPALGLYNVQKLPSNFLIDRKGIVVARDLYGAGLQRALEAQFE